MLLQPMQAPAVPGAQCRDLHGRQGHVLDRSSGLRQWPLQCYLTTGGAYFCSTGEGQCMACTTDAECAERLGTPGAACIDVNHGDCSCSSIATYCAMPCAK